jgi:hypothetical protein
VIRHTSSQKQIIAVANDDGGQEKTVPLMMLPGALWSDAAAGHRFPVLVHAAAKSRSSSAGSDVLPQISAVSW